MPDRDCSMGGYLPASSLSEEFPRLTSQEISIHKLVPASLRSLYQRCALQAQLRILVSSSSEYPSALSALIHILSRNIETLTKQIHNCSYSYVKID